MTHDEAIRTNLDQANQQLQNIHGNQPTDVVRAAMGIAQVFATVAIVSAVRELADEVRKLGGDQ